MLNIYVVDVEGGNATLFVAPSGESVLIDTGNGGRGRRRDAERILAAVEGRRPHADRPPDHDALARRSFRRHGRARQRIPIEQFIDHGANVQPHAGADEFLRKVYPALYARATHTVAKPGDKIPIGGLEWRIVAAAGEHISTPLPGAGKPNPLLRDVSSEGCRSD